MVYPGTWRYLGEIEPVYSMDHSHNRVPMDRARAAYAATVSGIRVKVVQLRLVTTPRAFVENRQTGAR